MADLTHEQQARILLAASNSAQAAANLLMVTETADIPETKVQIQIAADLIAFASGKISMEDIKAARAKGSNG